MKVHRQAAGCDLPRATSRGPTARSTCSRATAMSAAGPSADDDRPDPPGRHAAL